MIILTLVIVLRTATIKVAVCSFGKKFQSEEKDLYLLFFYA